MSDLSKKEQEFVQAYEANAAKVYRHVRLRVARTEDAEDITSKTFMKTWDYIAGGKRVLNMKAFIFRVANNLIIDWYRSKNNQPIPMEDVEQAKLGVVDNRLDQQLDAVADVAQLEKALDTIDPIYRDVLVLKFVEEYSTKEIAKKLDVSENVVYVRLHRGKKQLTEVLETKVDLENIVG